MTNQENCVSVLGGGTRPGPVPLCWSSRDAALARHTNASHRQRSNALNRYTTNCRCQHRDHCPKVKQQSLSSSAVHQDEESLTSRVARWRMRSRGKTCAALTQLRSPEVVGGAARWLVAKRRAALPKTCFDVAAITARICLRVRTMAWMVVKGDKDHQTTSATSLLMGFPTTSKPRFENARLLCYAVKYWICMPYSQSYICLAKRGLRVVLCLVLPDGL